MECYYFWIRFPDILGAFVVKLLQGNMIKSHSLLFLQRITCYDAKVAKIHNLSTFAVIRKGPDIVASLMLQNLNVIFGT